MSTPNSLVLEPVTIEDLPAITELWFTVFNDPGMTHLMPNTPGIREWFTQANRTDMLTKPYQKYLKVVDPNTKDAQGRSRIAAYAKWDLAMPDERGPRFPPWHGDMPQTDCEKFFGSLESERKRVMGDRKHYYLDMLGTHPDYRCRGAGSMLVRWGCDIADREGVGAYIDASEAGVPLYTKYGFVDRRDPARTSEVTPMARV
ncbi:Acyl-CoA N-acyltransferase [Penicillium paradoxum]|uniref:Acyl-CoA N-acyltransferase n=1 Tax=Penicillium paradoxum TaxID=176176 RepID=UPI002548E751|nr:Acyl-CoA N-acyltransferase [Penicillium paradoxum]KAJ5774882.1 Acyl-CoA N-acyltransferase [Penicillium paradoxum]